MFPRKLLATACAVALGAGSLLVSAPSTHAYEGEIANPRDARCMTAIREVKQGKEITDVNRYFFGLHHSNIRGNTLKLYNTTPYGSHLKEAMDAWIDATGGLLRVEYVDHRDPEAVTVELGPIGGTVAGRQEGMPGDNPRVILNESLYYNPANIHHASMVMTLAHEVGHAMGLAHSCVDTLMKSGSTGGSFATLPTKFDAQVLIQTHPDLRRLNGQPMPTATPEPEPSQEPESEPTTEPTTETSVEPKPEPSPEPEPEPTPEPTPETSDEPTTGADERDVR